MTPVPDATTPTTLTPGGTNAVGRILGLLGWGEPFIGELTCDQCAQPLKGAQVSLA